MKKIISFAAIALVLLTAAAGCGNASPAPISEESGTTIQGESNSSYEEPTSSYDELTGEIERLEQLLGDNSIPYWLREGRHPIDISMFKELEKPENMSTMGMARTVIEHGDMWKAEMEKYYGLLLKGLTAEHKKLLIASQKKWEAFVDDNNELEYEILFMPAAAAP